MLNITKTIEDTKACYSLEGRLDTITAPDLEKDLKENTEGINELILDFEKLEYISSAGLRVLLSAHKSMMGHGQMKITHVNETIMEVFEITGFSEILSIE